MNKREVIAKLEIVLDMLKGDHELPRAKVQIDPEVLEAVQQQPGIFFQQIEDELNRLCALANGGEPVEVNEYFTRETDKIEPGLPPKEDDGAKYGPEMKKVQSSNVDSFGYTHTTQTLRVKFTNGQVYDYFKVPAEIAEGLEKAQSPGGFLNAHIKGSFKYEKAD